jgi:hypothetical protein
LKHQVIARFASSAPPSRPRAERSPGLLVAALASISSISGCLYPSSLATEVGLASSWGVGEDTGHGSLGTRSLTTTQLGRDEGLRFGLELTNGAGMGPERPHPSDRWSMGAVAGYGWTPLPHRPRVGFELLGTAAVGRYHVANDSRLAVGLGPRLTLPIRLGKSEPLWESEEMIGPSLMLVPDLGFVGYLPTADCEHQHLHGELTAGLTLRMHLWSSLFP